MPNNYSIIDPILCNCGCNKVFKNKSLLYGHLWYIKKVGGLQESAKIKKICLTCNSEFETYKSVNSTYCSRKCVRKSEEWKVNHSLIMIGKKRSKETCLNISLGKKGKKWTKEHCKNWADAIRGKKQSEETCLKKSKSMLGRVLSEEIRQKISKAVKGKPHLTTRREKHYKWKGGITSLIRSIYMFLEYKNWRISVFIRDKHTCQECNKIQGGEEKIEIEAHHIKPFTVLVSEFLKKYFWLNIEKDKEQLIELAREYSPFWEINNGKTLCKKCHKNIKKETHSLIKNMKIGE